MEQKDFFTGWGYEMLTCLGNHCSKEDCKAIMHSCAEYHYRQNNMDEILNNYINDLTGFISFLSIQWGWKVEYNENEKTITADENKDQCVCPITAQFGKENTPAALCYCSEGFAEKMFSKVIGKPVKAEVIRSVIRGDASCVYEIKILD